MSGQSKLRGGLDHQLGDIPYVTPEPVPSLEETVEIGDGESVTEPAGIKQPKQRRGVERFIRSHPGLTGLLFLALLSNYEKVLSPLGITPRMPDLMYVKDKYCRFITCPWAGKANLQGIITSDFMVPRSPAEDEIRLVCLGDSLPAGFSLPYGKGVIEMTQDELTRRVREETGDQKKHFNIPNFSTAMYGTTHCLARWYTDAVRFHQPGSMVIASFVVNDIAGVGGVLLEPDFIPKPVVNPREVAFDRFRKSIYGFLVNKIDIIKGCKSLEQQARLADTEFITTLGYKPFKPFDASTDYEEWSKPFADMVRRLFTAITDNDGKIVAVIWPSQFFFHPEKGTPYPYESYFEEQITKILKEEYKESVAAIVNIGDCYMDYLRSHPGSRPEVLFVDPVHPSGLGHALAVKPLADAIFFYWKEHNPDLVQHNDSHQPKNGPRTAAIAANPSQLNPPFYLPFAGIPYRDQRRIIRNWG